MRMKGTTGRMRVLVVATATLAVSTVAAVVFAVQAPAAPTPPAPSAPTITAGPSGTATSATATFTYRASQTGVSFRCALDGAAPTPCPASGKTYTDLADGPHSFAVTAQRGTSPLSAPTTRTWVVEATAPALTLAFPADGGAYNAAAWSAGCSPVGACGTASDPSGVTSVQIAIYKGLVPTYVAATLANPGATTTTWRLAMARPSDGTYSVRLRATDALGNTTSSTLLATTSFRVDTVAPPPPLVLEFPAGSTSQTSAHFVFSDVQLDVSYRCSLDQAAFASCGPTHQVDELLLGPHCMRVVAVDPAGNQSSASERCWTVVVGNASFTVTGDVTQALKPGGSATLDLRLSNPNSFAIEVTNVTVLVSAGTTRAGATNPGCVGTDNLVVTRQLGADVTLPRNATRSLSQLGVPESLWPQLTMPNRPVNQDACKATTFTFTFSGSAGHA